MNAKRVAIKNRIDRKPRMGSSGRVQYGGAGLSRKGAERQFGHVLERLAGLDRKGHKK